MNNNSNSNNNLIYGKKINDYLLTNEEKSILNKPMNEIFGNPDTKNKFLIIFKKIFNLSSVHKNIFSIFESFNMTSLESIKKYASTFDYKSFLSNPTAFVTKKSIPNINLESKEKNYLKSRIRTNNPLNNQRNNPAQIDKSIFVLFLLFQKLQNYLIFKKSEFNQLIKHGVNSEKRRETIKKLNGFRLIAKKFIKIREKLFKLIQLQYVEPPIPETTELRYPHYYYYHFLRNIRERTPKPYDYDIYQENMFNTSNNTKLGISIFNTNLMKNKYHIFNVNPGTKEINYTLNPITHSAGINRPIKESINVFNLISLYYINNPTTNNRIDTIITKRNNNFYIYKYKIDDTPGTNMRIIKSFLPKEIYINNDKLQKELLENNSKYGKLSRIYISLQK